jgi:hypothetical protein
MDHSLDYSGFTTDMAMGERCLMLYVHEAGTTHFLNIAGEPAALPLTLHSDAGEGC